MHSMSVVAQTLYAVLCHHIMKYEAIGTVSDITAHSVYGRQPAASGGARPNYRRRIAAQWDIKA